MWTRGLTNASILTVYISNPPKQQHAFFLTKNNFKFLIMRGL
jgi:hypothetical protein